MVEQFFSKKLVLDSNKYRNSCQGHSRLWNFLKIARTRLLVIYPFYNLHLLDNSPVIIQHKIYSNSIRTRHDLSVWTLSYGGYHLTVTCVQIFKHKCSFRDWIIWLISCKKNHGPNQSLPSATTTLWAWATRYTCHIKYTQTAYTSRRMTISLPSVQGTPEIISLHRLIGSDNAI
jgi:hypothetical protein